MSIRLRRAPDGHLVALCAAATAAQTEDRYLDDEEHLALVQKFWRDYSDTTTGLPDDPGDRVRANSFEEPTDA